MNLWQNPNSNLGQPLTRQQQLLISEQGLALRHFWFIIPQSNTLANQPEALKTRLLTLMEQHQALSSYYGMPDGFDIIRQQVQTPRLAFNLQTEILASPVNNAERLTYEENASTHFFAEQPHLSVSCWQNNNSGITLLLTAPALTFDNISAYHLYTLLTNSADLNTEEAEPVMQYPEYIDWINELLNDEDAQDASDFWHSLKLTELVDAKLTECKSTQPLASQQVTQYVTQALPEALQVKLNQLAEQLDCQPTDIIVNVWAVLLSKLSGANELRLDCYHDCRLDYEEFEQAIGLYSQPLPVPFYQLNEVDLTTGCKSFSHLFDELKENQEYVGLLKQGPQNIALLQSHAGFSWHQQVSATDMFVFSPVGNNDLLLDYLATEQGDGKFTLFFNASSYQQSSIERALKHFVSLLATALDDPQQKIAQLNALLPDDKMIANEQAISSIANTDIVSLFKLQVKASIKQPAIMADGLSFTYQQLDDISNYYAGHLQTLSAKSEKIIAICLPRTSELLISMLAILKTGAAYLPLDPEQPLARLQQIIDDAQPEVLITDLEELTAKKCINTEALKQPSAPFEPVVISPQQLAYVLYTSGSTGQPKGVQVEHQQIAHYSQAVIEQLQLPQNGHYGLISSLMADLGNTMLFPAWLTGSCLHLLSKEQAHDGQALAQYQENTPLDCLKIVPSHLEALLDGNKGILPQKVLVLGGEPIQNSLFETLNSLSPSCNIYNHYGPTETTVGIAFGKIDLNNNTSALQSTIGDNQLYLLDGNQQPVMSGQCAELYVSGANVTRGYLNDTERTAQVYLDNPYSQSTQANMGKMYRTGDLAYRHADGSLSILGRTDKQVKIRGFRLDLNEIVQLLLQQPGIAQANIQVQGQGESATLLAFVIQQADNAFNEKQLLTTLKNKLPNYMVPTRIYALPQFPLNSNGKIDGKQLIALAEAQQQQVFIAPKNSLEQQISDVWQSVLRQQKICVTADFFDIGGHSLAAIKVIAQIRQKLSLELPTDLLFHHRSIVEMATYIDNINNSAASVNSDERLVALNDKAKRENSTDNNIQAPILVLMHSTAGHFIHQQPLIDNLENSYVFYGLTANTELLMQYDENQHNIKYSELIIDDYIEQLLPLKHRNIILVGWSLGGKQMTLMANRMTALGFNLSAVSIIDYDPAQTLSLENSNEQLITDFNDYLSANNLDLPMNVVTSAVENLPNDYYQAMQVLLDKVEIQPYLDANVSKLELTNKFMLRWKIKHLLYNTQIPKTDVPLWVWHGTGHQSAAQIWQQYSTEPIQTWYLDSNHYEILGRTELANQLVDNVTQLTPVGMI